MTEARPFASLSSGLLARKGAAKPAMRPAAFGSFGASLDDLGWNDMGEQPHAQPAEPEHVPSSIAALTPAPRPSAAEPQVREQQRAIADSLGAEEETAAVEPQPHSEPAPVLVMPRRRSGNARDKAAFTLRLDPDRHFRLRLACAVTGRSAQQIVTEALDDILKTYPEIDALAGHMPVKAGARS